MKHRSVTAGEFEPASDLSPYWRQSRNLRKEIHLMRLQDVSMKGLGAGLLGAGLLGLLLGFPVNVNAQDTRDDAKPPQEQPKQEEAKPAAPEAAPKDMKTPQEQPPAKAD